MSSFPDTLSLFVKNDIDLSDITPRFSRSEISLSVYHQPHIISLGAGGVSHEYSVTLPTDPDYKKRKNVSIWRADGNEFYGDAVALINEFNKIPVDQFSDKEKELRKWIFDNVMDMNISMHYWNAVSEREQVSRLKLSANIKAANVQAFVKRGSGLTDIERKQLIAEYGYNPDNYPA